MSRVASAFPRVTLKRLRGRRLTRVTLWGKEMLNHCQVRCIDQSGIKDIPGWLTLTGAWTLGEDPLKDEHVV